VSFFFTNSFKEAEQDCTKALELERNNLKAVWRRATARKELGLLDQAYEGATTFFLLSAKKQRPRFQYALAAVMSYS